MQPDLTLGADPLAFGGIEPIATTSTNNSRNIRPAGMQVEDDDQEALPPKQIEDHEVDTYKEQDVRLCATLCISCISLRAGLDARALTAHLCFLRYSALRTSLHDHVRHETHLPTRPYASSSLSRVSST